MVFPTVLGSGKRLFGAPAPARTLELVDAKPVGPDGVVILTYDPARRGIVTAARPARRSSGDNAGRDRGERVASEAGAAGRARVARARPAGDGGAEPAGPIAATASVWRSAPRPGLRCPPRVGGSPTRRGRVVILHGLNMVYKRPPYAPQAVGFGADDARFLRYNGFNTVRLGLIYKAVEPQPGRYDGDYIDAIRSTERMLASHGIFSLLDFHQDLYNEKFGGEGFPDWAVLDDGLPAEPLTGFPTTYLTSPGLNRAFDNLWANADGPGGVPIQARYAAAWARVADGVQATTRESSGYDLMNEPWPGSDFSTCVNTAGCPNFDSGQARPLLSPRDQPYPRRRAPSPRLLRAQRAVQLRRGHEPPRPGVPQARLQLPRLLLARPRERRAIDLPGGRAEGVRQRRRAGRRRPATRRCSRSTGRPTTSRPWSGSPASRTSTWSPGRSGTTAGATTRPRAAPATRRRSSRIRASRRAARTSSATS